MRGRSASRRHPRSTPTRRRGGRSRHGRSTSCGAPMRERPIPPPYVERWSPPRRLLCLAVKATRTDAERAELARLYDEVGFAGAAAVAGANRAESIVAHGLADAGIAGAPWDGWHAAWAARIGRLMALLDELAAAAAARGIPVVALKNGAIAR